MSTKPRSDSRLKTLPPARQEAIADYARDHSLKDTVAWLRADGLRTNLSSLSEFLSWYALRQQLQHNESTVETLLEQLKQSDPNISQEELDRAGQLFFTTLAIEQRDSLGWQRAQNVKLKQGSLLLESRRIAVLEKKAAQADSAKGILEDKKLTEAERTAKMHQLFGLK